MPSPSWSHDPSRIGAAAAAVCLLGTVIGVIVVTQGSGTESRAIETADTGDRSTEVAALALPIDSVARPTVTPLPLISVTPPAPTPLPSIQAPPTATPAPAATAVAILPTATTVPPTSTATVEPQTAPTETSGDPVATVQATAIPDPTETPEPTATAEPTLTVASDASDASEPASEPSSEPVSEPTANPQPAEVLAEPVPTAEVTPESTTSVATDALPAWSAGPTFNYVLFAGPSIEWATIYDEPNGQELQVTFESATGGVQLNDLQNPTWAGNTLALQVLRGSPGDQWAQISLPTRPNEQTGWIQTAGWEWRSSDFLIRINITSNTVQVWNGSELVIETGAVTGKPSSRTPLVTGFLDEKVYGLGDAYGPVALSLSFFSNDLGSFGGAPPKIALHGTNRNDLIGQHQSNGCIRIDNDVIRQISELVPVGSKVEIID